MGNKHSLPVAEPRVTTHFYIEPFSCTTQDPCNQFFVSRRGEFPTFAGSGVPDVLSTALFGREHEWMTEVAGPLGALCDELVDLGKLADLFVILPTFFIAVILVYVVGTDANFFFVNIVLFVVVLAASGFMLYRHQAQLQANEEVDRKIHSWCLRQNEVGLPAKIGAAMTFHYEVMGCGKNAKHIRYFSIRPRGGHASALNP